MTGEKEWSKYYEDIKEQTMTFPGEYVTRMFKGKYPNCNLEKLVGGIKERRF